MERAWAPVPCGGSQPQAAAPVPPTPWKDKRPSFQSHLPSAHLVPMELCYVRAWVQTKGLLFPWAPVWDSFQEGPKTLSHHLPGPRDHHPLKQGSQGWARGGPMLCLIILNRQKNWTDSKSKQAPFPSPSPELGDFWDLASLGQLLASLTASLFQPFNTHCSAWPVVWTQVWELGLMMKPAGSPWSRAGDGHICKL